MRLISILAAGAAPRAAAFGAALAITAAVPAQAADAAPQGAATVEGTAKPADDSAIVVTARKRTETLLNVPIAATALSGSVLESRGIANVREAAALSPGLNINSDGTGRAFIAIRGVGVTLVQSVQPGVGLFIDGIYQPNTSYLNNPLLDVDRIEVLRGPQGTLYGKNTLGGAINVITRAPTDQFEFRGQTSYAGPDNAWLAAGALSGPIVKDKIEARVAYSHREQDGFQTNSVIGGKANPFRSDDLNGTVRIAPSSDVTLTIKGYYDWIHGANTPYSRVAGPQDYEYTVPFNALNLVNYRYRGVSARLDATLGAGQKLSLIGSYDARDGDSPDGEGDFGPLDLVRTASTDTLRTKTTELRLDSTWNSQISTLFGLFYSNETTSAVAVTKINIFPPYPLVNTSTSGTNADTYAAFGTVFWKPNTAWEVALGLRYDHENRRATGGINGIELPSAQIKSNQVEPRLTLTRHWTGELMSYASVSRGYRGGGFNAVTAPQRTYQGDSAWTYEIGSRYVSMDRRITLSGDVFFNDYKNYIGLNSIAPASTGGLVTVDLNSGNVHSYGMELEGSFRPVTHWTISGGLTLMHARLINTDAYTATTGRVLSSDRLTFQTDVTFNLNSDYTIPVGGDREIRLSAGLVGKGKRLAATLNQTTPTFLDGYTLVNASIGFRTGPIEISGFVNNLFQKQYFESYIEKTTLQLAGLPASDLGIAGDRRRYGVRASVKF